MELNQPPVCNIQIHLLLSNSLRLTAVTLYLQLLQTTDAIFKLITMAVTSSQRQSSALQSYRPKFCTIILHPEDNYLKIEREFARRHGRDLPSTVFLKVHGNDKLRKIKVSKLENGELLFKNGWEKFKEYYFLSLGDFLVFKFDTSSSTFDVFLYDKTNVHIVGHIGEETRSESNCGLGQVAESHKRKKDKMAFRQEQESTKKRSKSARDHSKNKDADNVTNQEGGSSSQANCSFRTQIPFSCRYRLELAKGFIESSGINSHVEITLMNVEERGWLVANTCRTHSRCTFGSGWNNFLVDNKVIVGSTLEFKLVSESPCIIQVRVVKPGANQNELFAHCVRKRAERRQIVAERRQIVAESGSKWTFSRKVKAHHAYDMYIPIDFVRLTGIEAKSKIRLKLGEGKEGVVEVTSDKRCTRYSMSAGWNEFVKDNKVVEGSTISFEFIPNSNNVVEVQVLGNGTKGKLLVDASSSYQKMRREMRDRLEMKA